MEPRSRTTVAVRPAAALARRGRLFAALAEAFAVRFVAWEPGTDAGAVLEIADAEALASPAALRGHRVPALAVGGHEAEPAGERVAIALGSDALLDRRVRAITLHDRPVVAPADDADARGAVVLAEASGGRPVWTALAADATGPRVDRVATALPELGDGEVLYTLLGAHPVTAVALIGFLRAVQSPDAPAPPPLRACLLFDDPNLRWRTYGHIDYAQLLSHAREHDYHVSMAMVPLDAGRAHPPTAQLYARNADRLSLVFHGNDHVDNELLAADDLDGALRIAAQAVRRVAAFEQRTGLGVDRVMTPPHGLCSAAMTRALGAVGFDGLCAIHPRPWTPERPSDPVLASWAPAELVEGCAVIPRIPFGSSDADVALRALLDHPLVVYGHQEDVAGGLDPLAEIADRVRRVAGEVRWTSIGEIALSNATLAREDDVLVVVPYSRRVRVEVPAGVRALRVALPTGAAAGLTGWRGDGEHAFGADVPVAAGRTVEVRLAGAHDVDPATVPAPTWSPWPRLRRAATEARDRAVTLRAISG